MMKICMAGKIAAAGERGSTEMLMWGWGAVELAPLNVLRTMADEGAEVESWRKK
jgi:hypothetical protein